MLFLNIEKPHACRFFISLWLSRVVRYATDSDSLTLFHSQDSAIETSVSGVFGATPMMSPDKSDPTLPVTPELAIGLAVRFLTHRVKV